MILTIKSIYGFEFLVSVYSTKYNIYAMYAKIVKQLHKRNMKILVILIAKNATAN